MNVKEGDKKGLGVFERSRTEVRSRGAFARGIDTGAVILGFLLGGCHTVFGAYPLGIAFASALPERVWYALVGAAFGSLLRGEEGIIYAMATLLSVLLRVIVSGAKTSSPTDDADLEPIRRVFAEGVGLRVSCAVIGGFVCALYEVLLFGMSWTTVLYGVSMVMFSGIGCAVFSCAFGHGIGVNDLLFSRGRLFTRRKTSRERLSLLLFRVGALALIFSVSLSLVKLDLFGINMAYVFAAAITMLCAKRFGALYGAVTGFIASVGISGIYSPALLLGGAALGALFTLGSWCAIAVGAVVTAIWCAYVGGVSGFLTVLPEFLIASLLMMPLFRHLEREREPAGAESVKRRATDMVGTMALSYRNGKDSVAGRIGAAMDGMARSVRTYLGASDLLPASFFARITKETASADAEERELDEDRTDKLEAVLSDYGFSEGVARCFGKRRPYVICAAEDKDGDRISSSEFRRRLSEASGVALCEPEYYRRSEMVVMVAECRPSYVITGAFATKNGTRSAISGDTAALFESENKVYHALISDGMGSGEEAKRTSEFVSSFMKSGLDTGASVSSLIGAINITVRARAEECGASIDLFSFDLVTGEASFVKSGASPSFIKRGTSLFRIRSRTLPVGVMSEVDAERIGASVEVGDLIIMISDGVSADAEAPWLINLLHLCPGGTLEDYAQTILAEAERQSGAEDDATVVVLRVGKK